MKKTNVLLIVALLLLFSTLGYGQEQFVEIREAEKRDAPRLKGFPNLVYKNDLITGEFQKVCDLNKLEVFRLINYLYDNQRDILFINNYEWYYNIKVVDLARKKVIKTIMLNAIDPVGMSLNSSSGNLYVSFWEEGSDSGATSIFDKKYELLRKIPNFTMRGNRVYSSKNNEYHYLFGYDSKIKKETFLIIDAVSGDVIKKKEITELAIKGEYANIRDGKNGILLIEYRFKRRRKKTETYMLYDPLKDKVLNRIDNIPYHVGMVYLDDSLNYIVINEAKLISIGDKRTRREYTGKVIIYDLVKKKKIKELLIGKDAKIEIVKDKIYYRKGDIIRTHSIP